MEALAAPEQPVERTEELPPVPIPLVPAGREKPAPVPPAPAEPIKPSPAAPSAPEKADSATRVIELPQKEPPAKTKKPAKDAAAPPIEDMEGQMKLDDYVEPAVSAPTEAPAPPPAPAAESPAEPAAVLPEGRRPLGCGKRRPHPGGAAGATAGKKSRNFKRSGRRMAWISSWPETRKRTTTPPRSR